MWLGDVARVRGEPIGGQGREEPIKILSPDAPAAGRAQGRQLEALTTGEQAAALNPTEWGTGMAPKLMSDSGRGEK
jgi:hypothetical protein